VQEIGLFATTLKNLEGLYIYVPNSEVWRNRLQNFARHTERKFIETIGVGYDSDLKKTQAIVLSILNDVADVKQLPTPPECYVMNFGDSAITLSCRCWVPADNWLARTSDIRIAIKSAFDKEGIEIPFPQRVVTTKTG
jgi:small conductance mechanosensitive channel